MFSSNLKNVKKEKEKNTIFEDNFMGLKPPSPALQT